MRLEKPVPVRIPCVTPTMNSFIKQLSISGGWVTLNNGEREKKTRTALAGLCAIDAS